MVVLDVLSTFDHATNVFSYVYEPNIHLVILETIKIVHSISEASKSGKIATISNILERMKAKWCAYFGEFPYIYGIVVILDPGLKLDALVEKFLFASLH